MRSTPPVGLGTPATSINTAIGRASDILYRVRVGEIKTQEDVEEAITEAIEAIPATRSVFCATIRELGKNDVARHDFLAKAVQV